MKELTERNNQNTFNEQRYLLIKTYWYHRKNITTNNEWRNG